MILRKEGVGLEPGRVGGELSSTNRCVLFQQLVDLGGGVLGQGSYPGCPAADCLSSGVYCGLHGRSVLYVYISKREREEMISYNIC